MSFMKWFIRLAGIYNASAVIVFLTPGALGMLGVPMPNSPFWIWLSGLMGLFAGIVLFISSSDLEKYAPLPFWNGIIRLIFVIASFSLDFGSTAGELMGLLAWGDIPLALGAIIGMPLATKRSPLSLLLAR
jgi:hypothetical protein